MSFNNELYKFLITQTTLTNKISTRIYTDTNVTNKLLSLYFNTISESEVETFESQTKVLTDKTIQFDVVGFSRYEVVEVTDILRNIFKNKKSFKMGNIDVSAVIKINRFQSQERNATTGEEFFIETLEYVFSYYQ
jgi:hypothetical protein